MNGRDDLSELKALLAVAEERSFTRCSCRAGRLAADVQLHGSSASGPAGVRLLARTTRSVSPTGAGERLLRTAGPLFDGIVAGMNALGDYRDKPAGTIRINADEHSVDAILSPALGRILPEYPDMRVEVTVDHA